MGGASSEMVMTGTGAGAAVDGFIGPAGSVSDPSVPYPAAPPAGFTSHPEGLRRRHPRHTVRWRPDAQLYCIDILTLTYGGIGYNLGTWDASSVNNVGFVAYLLNHYFPDRPELRRRSATTTSVPLRCRRRSGTSATTTSWPRAIRCGGAVAAIVEDARTNGPLVQPPPPSLQITPATATGPIGTPLGPYTVTSPQGAAVVNAIGAAMFSDAAATTPIANGASVADGAQIWLQQAAIGSGDPVGHRHRDRAVGQRVPVQRELRQRQRRPTADPRPTHRP